MKSPHAKGKAVKLKKFTVIGYYEDNNQPYGDHVMATDAWDAAARCAVKPGVGGDLIIVDVLAGHHMSLLESDADEPTCIAACDLPGVERCEVCDKLIIEEKGCPECDPMDQLTGQLVDHDA